MSKGDETGIDIGVTKHSQPGKKLLVGALPDDPLKIIASIIY